MPRKQITPKAGGMLQELDERFGDLLDVGEGERLQIIEQGIESGAGFIVPAASAPSPHSVSNEQQPAETIRSTATATMTLPFESTRLNALLADELAAGNRVRQDGDGGGGWGKFRRLVMLQRPFRALPSPLPAGLEHHAVNDPHYWQAEVVDTQTSEMLACGFGETGSVLEP